MEKSDEEIISRILDGRKQEFSLLIHRYQKQIYNLMYRYSHSEHDAADLTQDAFLRAYEKLASFRAGSSFFSWLYAVAVNLANDWSRRRSRHRKKERDLHENIPHPTENNSTQEMHLENREDIRRLQQVMHMLSDETREILILRFHHGRSVREVATVFSISESAVKMRTSRGLRQLQDLMGGEN